MEASVGHMLSPERALHRYRLVAKMFHFVHLTGVASLCEMCLKTTISLLINSAPNSNRIEMSTK